MPDKVNYEKRRKLYLGQCAYERMGFASLDFNEVPDQSTESPGTPKQGQGPA